MSILETFDLIRILVIEDDPGIQIGISASLPSDFFINSAFTSTEARSILERDVFDLIVLDLTLPDEDGMSLCSWIRADERLQAIPIILLTGRTEVDAKVMAFSLGVDDYLIKPIDPKEFKARILAKIKKSRIQSQAEKLFSLGNLKFLISTQQLFITEISKPIEIAMSSLEFRLLLLLAQNESRVFSRDELISKIWGEQVYVLDRTVDSHVSDIRKKITQASYSIQSVRGVGYQLTPQIIQRAKKG